VLDFVRIEGAKNWKNGIWCRTRGVSVRNPAFDVTPAELVTALITEKGVVHHPNIQNISALFK
jgi:methylthioribose-1-phosphate isomerase